VPPIPAQLNCPERRVQVAQRPAKEREKRRLAHVEWQKNKAWRDNPNVFNKEDMLYINAIVNGVQMPLFVDTGAQASVMSLETCRRLGLAGQID